MDTRVSYSEDELLAEWCKRHAPQHVESEAWGYSHEQMEATLRGRLRTWYATLLRTAPKERLPIRDIKDMVQVQVNELKGLEVQLPAGGGQVVEVMCSGWKRPVRYYHRAGGLAERWQVSKYLHATPMNPVVIEYGDKIVIYGLSDGVEPQTQLLRLLMTMWPEDGRYEFDLQEFPNEKMSI